jgi:triacylglycerol lipase
LAEEADISVMRAALFAGALLLSGAVAAQVPPDIAARTRAAGQTMDPGSAQGYAALFPPEAWEDVSIERDVAYGPDPLHKLDIYTAPHADARRPVLLFVHGGGYTRGDKHGAFYPDNITLWAAKQGMVGVNINYRLAPQAPFPEAARDLAAAIAWTRANAVRYGGDPDRIILFGHSAGGNHVADYLGNPEVQGEELAAVKGAVLLSPSYPAYPGDPLQHPYYGPDAEPNTKAGAIRRLLASPVQLFLADAEFDPDLMQGTANALRTGLCEMPARCPRYVRLKDHNHFTEGMAVGTDDRSLTGPLLEWIADLTGERG